MIRSPRARRPGGKTRPIGWARAAMALALGLVAWSAPARGQGIAESSSPAVPPAGAPATSDPVREPDTTLAEYRTPFEALTERAIGTASRPVRFDWRRTSIGFGVTGSQLDELNDFWSTRYGGLLRTPSSGLMVELAFTRVSTWGTDSTEKLSRTPYRQYGRPSRFEIDLNLAFPVAEGVITAWPRFFPATELVVSATAGFRYLLYPDGFGGFGFWDITDSMFNPVLSQRELANLLLTRPPGMQVDKARFGLLAGLTTDLYFQNGFFLSPRAMLAVPLLQTMTQSHLGFWWELSVGLGWAL